LLSKFLAGQQVFTAWIEWSRADLNHPDNVLFHVDEATNAGFVGQNVTYKFKIDGQKRSMATTIKSATGGEVEFLSTYERAE
jgi:hypothetical protein